MGVGHPPTGIRVGLTAILRVVILRRSRAGTSNTWLDQHETCRCTHSYQKRKARRESHE